MCHSILTTWLVIVLTLITPSIVASTTTTNRNKPPLLKNPSRLIPPLPVRPSYVDPRAFHGSRFDFFDEIAARFGFIDDGKNPAVVHSPVFLYGRSARNMVIFSPSCSKCRRLLNQKKLTRNRTHVMPKVLRMGMAGLIQALTLPEGLLPSILGRTAQILDRIMGCVQGEISESAVGMLTLQRIILRETLFPSTSRPPGVRISRNGALLLTCTMCMMAT